MRQYYFSILSRNVNPFSKEVQGFHKALDFVKTPSRGPTPGPFLRLLRKLEGEKNDFRGMGGRNAATHTPKKLSGEVL